MQAFLLLPILLGFSFKDSLSSQELTIRVNKKMEIAREAIDDDTNREKRESRYREASAKVKSLMTAADYLDDQITMLEDSLVETVETARATMTAATEKDHALQVSYGLSVLAANVFYTENVIWGKPVDTFLLTDWGTIGSNLGYFWGYGAPYLVEGQLGSPDPGCGVEDMMTAMDSNYIPSLHTIYQPLASDTPTNPYLLIQPQHHPALVKQAVLERDRAMRSSISCLSGQGEVTTILDNLKTAYLVRLGVTQAVIDCLVDELG